MNALRTLPILNRPSRPSSPAPPTVQSTTASAVPPTTTEKPRSRSLSRQVADKVSSLQISTNGTPAATTTISGNGNSMPPPVYPSQPLTKKISPPGTRSATPRSSMTPLPPAPAGEQGPAGGYMDVIGLRLNETVNKASAGVDFKAKKGFKKGSGLAVGEAVVKELPTPPSDAYFMRAVLRTSVRALSIFTTRLESLLLPALTDSSFIAPLNLSPLLTAHPLNPVQYFALSVAHAAWETCETLELTLETGKWPKFVSEALRPVMDKLDLVVSKVAQPLLLGLKRDLVASLMLNEGISPPGGKTLGLASIPAPTTPGTSLAKESSPHPSSSSRLVKEFSASGAPRTLTIPACLQHFASRVDGARRVFEVVARPCADDGEGWITGVMVSVIWKGMCVVAEKDLGPIGRPPSPHSVARALAGLHTKEKDSSTPGTLAPSPSIQGVTAKLASSLSLPSRSQSRAPSPPRGKLDPTTHALLSLEGLVKRLVAGLVQPPSSADDEDEHVAREAMSEALEALTSFRLISSAMHSGRAPSTRLLASARRLRDDIEDPAEDELDDAMEDLQPPILFSILSRQANSLLSTLSSEKVQMKIRHPAETWGWQPGEYERQVLATFSVADDGARRVAVALKPELERVLSQLAGLIAQRGQPSKECRDVNRERDILFEALEWVKCVAVSCEARCGVKVGIVAGE